MILGEYIKEFGAQPWGWAAADCCTFVSGWAVACGYPDPMGNLRGQYSTEDEARQIITEAGGMGALLDTRLTGVGMQRAKRGDAQPGDICVCTVPDDRGQMSDIAALWTGTRYAFFSDRGVVFLDSSAVKVRGRWR